MDPKREQEWFVALMQHLGKLLPRSKDQQDLTKQIFNVWEENMMDSIEDQTANTGWFFALFFCHVNFDFL